MDQAHFERWTRHWTAEAARDGVAARTAATRAARLSLVVPPLLVAAALAVATVGVLVAMIGWIVAIAFGGLLALTGFAAAGLLLHLLPTRLDDLPGTAVSRAELGLLFDRVERAALAIGVAAPTAIRLDESDGVSLTWHAPKPFARGAGELRIGLATIAMLEHDELDSMITVALANILHDDAEHLRWVQRAHAWWSAVDARVTPLVAAGNLEGAGLQARVTGQVVGATIGLLAARWVPRLAGMERTFWRDREMAADRIAMEATSRRATSRALVRAQVRVSWWRGNVTDLLDAAERVSAVPDPNFIVGAASSAGGEIAPMAGSVMFARVLTDPDDPLSPNTSIGRRLSAIGMGIDRPGVETVSFAEAASWSAAAASGVLWNDCFSTPGGAGVLTRIGTSWAARHSGEWRTAHERIARLDQQGQALSSEASTRELRADQYLLVAGWARARYGRDGARDWLRYVTHVDPWNARAALELGIDLATSGDPAGVGWLEHAARIAPDLAVDAGAWLAAWHRACGDQPGADIRVETRARHRATMRSLRWTPMEVRRASAVSTTAPTEREQRIVRDVAAEHPSIVLAAVARHEVRSAPLDRPPLTVAIEFGAGTTEAQAAATREIVADTLDRAWLGSAVDQVEVVTSISGASGHAMWTSLRNAHQTHVFDRARLASQATTPLPGAAGTLPAQPAPDAQHPAA